VGDGQHDVDTTEAATRCGRFVQRAVQGVPVVLVGRYSPVWGVDGYDPDTWNRTFSLYGAAQDLCVTMREVKQPPHRTVTRRCDEPELEIGDTISMEEGLVGVVLARYTRSGDVRNDVHYIVELRGEAEEH